MAVRTAKWIRNSANGDKNTGFGLPTCDVLIPAHATIQRVLYTNVIAGVATSAASTGYLGIQGAYLQNEIKVTPFGGDAHRLHFSTDIIPVSATAMFDSTQIPPPVGQNRLFYGVYSAGDRQVGQNIHTSWGGPGNPIGATVQTFGGVFTIGSAGASQPFQYHYIMELSVLIYS